MANNLNMTEELNTTEMTPRTYNKQRYFNTRDCIRTCHHRPNRQEMDYPVSERGSF